MKVKDIEGNKITVCTANKKCKDCKAFVTRWVDTSTENGFDFDEWEECAFKYVKKENWNRYVQYVNENENGNLKEVK